MANTILAFLEISSPILESLLAIAITLIIANNHREWSIWAIGAIAAVLCLVFILAINALLGATKNDPALPVNTMMIFVGVDFILAIGIAAFGTIIKEKSVTIRTFNQTKSLVKCLCSD